MSITYILTDKDKNYLVECLHAERVAGAAKTRHRVGADHRQLHRLRVDDVLDLGASLRFHRHDDHGQHERKEHDVEDDGRLGGDGAKIDAHIIARQMLVELL